MSNINQILEGLNSNRIHEAAVREEVKDLINKASLIGHEWWKYLDKKYFGPTTNSYSHVGDKTTGSDVERMCGRYVCHADFNSLDYSNSSGFIVGFNLAGSDRMEARIYHYEKDIEGHHAVLHKNKIVDTGDSEIFDLDKVDTDYVKYAKILADKVNDLAKREPKKR